MGWKTAGKLVVAALIGGGIIYQFKPGWVEKFKPAAEEIVREVKGEGPDKPSLIGKYNCQMVEEQRSKRQISKNWSQQAPHSSKNYALAVNVTAATAESVTLSSTDSDFSTTLSLAHRNDKAGFTSYQNVHTVFGSRPEGSTMNALDDGRLLLLHDHWFSKTRSRAKIGMCTLVAAGSTDNLIRAVFIRPCPGQLYPETFIPGNYRSDKDRRQLDPAKLAEVKTTPIETLGGVCKDLKASGITDIFIPFKVDDQGSAPGCGAYGQLLYPSAGYHDRVSNMVKDAQNAGFEPIGSLMQVCKYVYGNATIKFHAWFPVFKDPYAAQYAGTIGKLKFNDIDNGTISQAIDRFAALLDPSYTSRLFAEPANSKVVAYELSVLNEIVQAYPDLAGINLDYIRYPEVATAVDIPTTGEAPECIRDPRVEAIQKASCQSLDSKYIAKRVIWNVDGNAVDDFVRKVKAKFPNITLSADVFASADGRYGVGQYGIPALVDIIMPMDYSFFGVGDSNNVAQLLGLDRQAYRDKKLVPCLRGWASTHPQSKGLVADLNGDIAAARSQHTDGYAVFTYEALLHDTDSRSLSSLKSQISY